jgi:hypothetical protein
MRGTLHIPRSRRLPLTRIASDDALRPLPAGGARRSDGHFDSISNSALRHCEERRDEASQRRLFGSGLLPPSQGRFGGHGRFAHNGGGRGTHLPSRGAIRPSFATYIALSKAEGAGKAGWPLHPGPSRRKKLRERENHRYGGDHTGLPRAVVLRLIRALPGEPFRLPPSPGRSSDPQDLAPDIGAPEPHDFAVRVSTARQSAPSRPPHPRLTYRDGRETPSATRRDNGEKIPIFRK